MRQVPPSLFFFSSLGGVRVDATVTFFFLIGLCFPVFSFSGAFEIRDLRSGANNNPCGLVPLYAEVEEEGWFCFLPSPPFG